MISERYGMTDVEFGQAMMFDWRDLKMDTLKRELAREKVEHEIEVMNLKDDIRYLEAEVERYRKLYHDTLDYKIFN